MFRQFFAVARNAFLESIRQSIFVVLLLVVTALLILNVPMWQLRRRHCPLIDEIIIVPFRA